jgi:hypothetical protein
MKSARFATIVEKCGKPEAYLLLMDPAKDRTFQAAVKAQRVMTVLQEAVGTKTDRGEIGYQPGRNRQFLIFPKSLRAFAGRAVVGIKYDLLTSPEVPKSQRAPAPAKPKPKAKAKPARTREEPEPSKVVVFKIEPPEDEDEELADLKKEVRRAMALLEDGKTVAAFNLLKRAVG